MENNNTFNYSQFTTQVDSWITQLRTVSAGDAGQRLAPVLAKLQEVRTIVGQYRDAA